jgi:hypothetical protein
MQPRPYGSHGTSDDLADLLIAASFDVGEQHDVALIGAEVCKGFGNWFTQLAFDILLDWLN